MLLDDTIRTEMYCHACRSNFVAELEGGISGRHLIECPGCGHEHYRVIKDGVVTGDRWGQDSDNNSKTVRARSTWKSTVIQAKTSTVSQHIRERWMNRSDFNGR